MKKEHDFVLLPTEDYPAIAQAVGYKMIFGTKINELFDWIDCPIKTPNNLKHLFILSDEEIKEGDWCVQTNHERTHSAIVEYKYYGKGSYTFKKVIAATDPKLIADGVPTISENFIKDDFIPAYNKGGLEKIEVEYVKSCEYDIYCQYKKGKCKHNDVLYINSSGSIIASIPFKDPFNNSEIIKKGFNKLTSFDKIKDRYIGKKDTKNRDKFEEEVQQEIIEDAADKHCLNKYGKFYSLEFKNNFIEGAEWMKEQLKK